MPATLPDERARLAGGAKVQAVLAAMEYGLIEKQPAPVARDGHAAVDHDPRTRVTARVTLSAMRSSTTR
jgi:hypothetical protein